MPDAAADPSASYPLAPCCLPPATPSSAYDAQNSLCFFHPSTLASACIPPNSVSAFQCASDRDCPVGFCMASHLPHDPPRTPRADEQVRVLWMGNPEDLARRVRVGRVVATSGSAGVLPDWWPYVVVSVLELTVQASLSLAVVNAVPLGSLDGSELVMAVVAVVASACRAATGVVRPARPKLRPRYLSNNFGAGRTTDSSRMVETETVTLDRRDVLPLDRLDAIPLDHAATIPLHHLDTLPLVQADTIPLADNDADPVSLSALSFFSKSMSMRSLSIARHDTLPLPDDDSSSPPSRFHSLSQHDTLPLPVNNEFDPGAHLTSIHLDRQHTRIRVLSHSSPHSSRKFHSEPSHQPSKDQIDLRREPTLQLPMPSPLRDALEMCLADGNWTGHLTSRR
ncbi:hypothetical protein BCR44DRAFT_1437134 [Catenaria anguillulae PL171]|uniref:Uncharacterized protein n=1 Tax=Catenaria anguillulae PL171 TaxID=765915 RepID=A0A1Y2HHT3_9FUNG|nr:hypothetical protein BCR44DRAFT_1437134 [Catenaria anguillulae PL171]